MDARHPVETLLKRRGAARARDIAALGVSPSTLAALLASGRVERIASGLYVLPDSPVGEEQTLAEALTAVPDAVVCLLSALSHHGLTEENPTSVWLGLARGRRRPATAYPPIEPVWMSDASLRYGIATRILRGVKVPMTTPAKSVADAYKYRARVGAQAALFALRRYIETRADTLDALWAAATVCRVTRLIRPHAEALL